MRLSRGFAALCVALALAACQPPPDGTTPQPVGAVRVALTNVPTNAPCVRFTTTAGAQTVTQAFDASGSTLTATLNGLPFNQALSISATAFGVACSALTPGSLATYLSDPQTATLTPGQTISLSFTLRPTANVTASTDFLYVTLLPGSNDFGPVVIGQQSAPAAYTLTNIGMVATSAITATFLGGTGQFAFASNNCTTLAAGATCTIQPKFTPTMQGPQTTMLQVTAALGGAVQAILSGIGWTPAALTISAPSVNLGDVPVGTTVSGGVTITNNGDQPASGLNPILSPVGDFAIAPPACSGTLPGHQACQVTVRVTPSALGARSAALTVNGAPGGTVMSAFSANGIAPLLITPTTWTAPSVPRGTAGATQTFTISNRSTATSPVLSVSSPNASFVVKTNTCAGVTLTNTTTCAVSVQFVPAVTGAINGTLNVGGAAPWTVSASLAGTGL